MIWLPNVEPCAADAASAWTRPTFNLTFMENARREQQCNIWIDCIGAFSIMMQQQNSTLKGLVRGRRRQIRNSHRVSELATGGDRYRRIEFPLECKH